CLRPGPRPHLEGLLATSAGRGGWDFLPAGPVGERVRVSTGAEKTTSRTAPGEDLVRRSRTRVRFPPAPPTNQPTNRGVFACGIRRLREIRPRRRQPPEGWRRRQVRAMTHGQGEQRDGRP